MKNLKPLLKQTETLKTNNPEFTDDITQSRFSETTGDPINIPADHLQISCVLIRFNGIGLNSV